MTEYTYKQIADALNRAADDIADAVGVNEGPVMDAMNLLVNVGLSYLDGTADDVPSAIKQNYDALSDALDEGENVVGHVLSWLES